MALIKNWWIKLVSLIMAIFAFKEVIPPKNPDLFREPDILECRHEPYFWINVGDRILGVTTTSATIFATTTTASSF